MAKVQNGEEILPNVATRVGCTSVTDDRRTDDSDSKDRTVT